MTSTAHSKYSCTHSSPWRAKAAAPVAVQRPIAVQLYNTVQATRDYDHGAAQKCHRIGNVEVDAPRDGSGGHVETHAGVEIRWGGGQGGRGGQGGQREGQRERWMCSSFNGYDCRSRSE